MHNTGPISLSITERFSNDAYQLQDKIGQGGFGQVYTALQRNTNQHVAIKFLILNPEFDEDKKIRYIERFERETLLGSRLQHPNIVRLLDKGRCDDDLLWAVFEYVDGQTLGKALADAGALSPVAAAEIMTQVLDALAHAHEQGVIHRDIKPANIMLTQVGAKTHVKVLDFGIGTLVNEARQLDFKSITLTQETLGTPSYSAPEQLRGEPPTPKTDLYVWGLVFIECLTGKPAISGTSLASIFHKQLSSSNVPLPAAVVGHPVGALLRRVLQKKVHERSIDIAQLYQELIKLNFSSLVGTLTDKSIKSVSPDKATIIQSSIDETCIDEHHPQHFTLMTERKQLTAMCICLSVHSVNDEWVDHEVVETLHRDQKSECSDIAIRYGAFYVGCVGDTLLFYFGYPAVSDNDTRLCARTALDIVSTLNKRNSLLKHSQGIAAAARIGIHTGLVTTDSDAPPEGDTPNIAMALARQACDNQALCSQSSKKLLENHIEFELDENRVIGVDAIKTPTYSLKGERQVEAFGFLRSNSSSHSFVGRDDELTTLQALLTPSKIYPNKPSDVKPKARLAHVYGEAGIGKSRLIFELRNKAHQFSHIVIQCLPEHENNALYPVFELLKHQYALDTLTPAEAVQRLNDSITLLDLPHQEAALVILCIWINLPLTADMTPTALALDIQKQCLFSALTGLLTLQQKRNNQDTKQRNLYIFEDMHWADPTSIEFIQQFTQALRTEEHVFVSTSRKVAPTILENQGFTTINVVKLNPAKTTEFIIQLFDGQAVSQTVLDVLLSRTDGIPLFIEELVTMLKQKQLVHHLNGRIDFVSSGKRDIVPNTLRDSLQQKLDTLGYAKETAQLAATIGRAFDYELLVAASSRSEEQIQTDLNELIEAELIFQQRRISGDHYIFKHALVNSVAAQSIAKRERILCYRNVIAAIHRIRPEYENNQPALMGFYCIEAQDFEQGLAYYLRAANSNNAKGLHQQAEQMLHRGLDILSDKQNNCYNVAIDAEFRLALAVALSSLKGFSDQEVEFNYQYLSNLDVKGLNSDLEFAVYFVSIVYGIVTVQHQLSHDSLAKLKKLMVVANHGKFTSPAFFMEAQLLTVTGQSAQALSCLEQVIESFDEAHIPFYNTLIGYDLRCAATVYGSIVSSRLGCSTLSDQWTELSLTTAKSLNHPHTHVHSLIRTAQKYLLMGDVTAVERYTTETLKLARRYGYQTWIALGSCFIGWVQAHKGHYQQGLNQLTAGYDAMAAAGLTSHQSWLQSLIAQAHCLAGDMPAAEQAIAQALQLHQDKTEALYFPEILMVQRMINVKLGQPTIEIDKQIQHLTQAQGLRLTGHD